jgi:hypothetical protein
MSAHRFVRSAAAGWTLSTVLFGLSGCGGPADPEQSQRALAPDPAKTVTIQVHGWNLSGSTKDGMVGDDRGGGDVVDGIRRYVMLPHGTSAPNAPNQIVGTEYYGDKFPSYYTAADEAEVKALKGIPRYALIVAKYARHVMQRSGAEGINLTCHSMGCLISRYLIENDVGKLASEGRVKRWVSFAGVVNGVALADIDDGTLSNLAKLVGLDLIDVQHMNRKWVEANVVTYDNKRVEGNNPNWSGILVHHFLATNPKIDTAWSIPLMDLRGYANVPNDGIVLNEEMFLQKQADAAKWATPSGTLLPVSLSRHLADHFHISEHRGAQALAAAAVSGKRRARIYLQSVTLVNDKESIFFDKPPAEVAVESKIRSPYVRSIDPSDPLLDEVLMERRNAPVLRMNKGETKAPELLLFDGPVFDAQTSLNVSVKLSETDFYPAGGVNENLLSPNVALGSFDQEVPLMDGDYSTSTGDVRFTLRVKIETLY